MVGQLFGFVFTTALALLQNEREFFSHVSHVNLQLVCYLKKKNPPFNYAMQLPTLSSSILSLL